MTIKKLSARQARWSELLSRFHFLIRYRPGKQNPLTDALSRRQKDVETQNRIKDSVRTQVVLSPECLELRILEELEPELTAVNASTSGIIITITEKAADESLNLINRILQANRTNEDLQKDREKAEQGLEDWTLKQGLLKRKGRLVVPDQNNLRIELLNEIHRQKSMAHPGKNKTREMFRGRYYWAGIARDVDRYVANCYNCRKTRVLRDLLPGLLNFLPVLQRPWQHVSIDF